MRHCRSVKGQLNQQAWFSGWWRPLSCMITILDDGYIRVSLPSGLVSILSWASTRFKSICLLLPCSSTFVCCLNWYNLGPVCSGSSASGLCHSHVKSQADRLWYDYLWDKRNIETAIIWMRGFFTPWWKTRAGLDGLVFVMLEILWADFAAQPEKEEICLHV